MYLSWAAYFEGQTDAEYFGVIIPRILEDIFCRHPTLNVIVPEHFIRFGKLDRSVDAVAKEACEYERAFDIWFIHADTGGRALASKIETRSESFRQKANLLCKLAPERAVILAPKKETESWVLADRNAVLSSFGVSENVIENSLPDSPRKCESLVDPKFTIDSFAKSVNARRYRTGAASLFPSIAIKQDINLLRQIPSFQKFEDDLLKALHSLGYIR